MKIFRCNKTYWLEVNDGNEDIKICIHEGTLFLLENITDLPGNYSAIYSEYFELQSALGGDGGEG